MRLFLSLLFCGLLAACAQPNLIDREAAARGNTSAVADTRVLIVADVHLDPFDHKDIVDQLAAAPITQWEAIFRQGNGGRTASYGHDANAALFFSSLQAMKASIPHPAYILLAGDLLAHDFYKRFAWTATENDDLSYHRFIDKTSDFITYELTKTYPHTQMFPTIGNNDGYCGDYAEAPHDAYLAHQAHVWAPIIDPEHHFPDIVKTFAQGGYYRAEAPGGLRIISFNSVYLAKAYTNRCGDPQERPAVNELAWLHEAMREKQAPPTLILTHIPVGIDGFKTFFHLGFPVPLLTPEYQTAFLGEVNPASHHVTAIITGHLHDVGYRQTDEGAGDNKPVLITPSISPIFGNSPAFSIVSLGKTGSIDDFEVHRFQTGSQNTPTWDNVVDFNQRYQLHGVNAATIEALHRMENGDRNIRSLVTRDSVGNAPALAVTTLDWKSLWCTNGALTPQTFLSCEGVVSATPSRH